MSKRWWVGAMLISFLAANGFAADDAAVKASLTGTAPEGFRQTYTQRPPGLVFQQLILRASGAAQTYPGLEAVNAAVEVVLRRHGLLPEGNYEPTQAPTLESGEWAMLTDEELRPAEEALVAYFRRVRDGRTVSLNQRTAVQAAQDMLPERYPQRRDEWEKLSFWTIHTFSLAARMAAGFTGTDDPALQERFTREFRDWVVAYASYKHYVNVPGPGRLGDWPHIWGDQWHMERVRAVFPAYFTLLAPGGDPVMTAPTPGAEAERFDFWFLRFALDNIWKANDLAEGYRSGNHGWFQILAAANSALLFPEFKVADRTLQNCLKRAVEHCLDDNRLDGWHRESTTSYMDTYTGTESALLYILKQRAPLVTAWQQRTGIDLSPYIGAIEKTLQRQRNAEEVVRLPDQSYPAFGDCGGGKGDRPKALPDFLSNCLPGAGFYLMRSGWEKTADSKDQVGLAFNGMDVLTAHNCSDLLSVMLYAYGTMLLHKPPTYRYENSEHWYKRSTQSTNTAMPGDFANDSAAPERFDGKAMFGPEGTSWGPWPSNTAAYRFDQTGSGPVESWRGAATNCARVTAWATTPLLDYVDAYHDRYVRSVEAPWPTGDKPFGPRFRRSVLFIRSTVGGVGPYALLTDTFTNPTTEPLAGDYHDLNVLFHMPVSDTWPTTPAPWTIAPNTKRLRTRYESGANLTIAPADPERLIVRQVKGLWTRPLKPGEVQESGFSGMYSYTAPYVDYALTGDPAPVPAVFQAALYPDRPGESTDVRVRRLAVPGVTDQAQAAAVEVAFSAKGIRDIIFVAAKPGVAYRFGAGECDGVAAWLRLRDEEVLAAGVVNGSLRWDKWKVATAPLVGTVKAAEPTLRDGYLVNRLTLDGPEIPGTVQGARIALSDTRGELVTSYQVLEVLSPHEVLLSEARRVASGDITETDAEAGTVSFSAGESVRPGMTLQVISEGRSEVLRVVTADGARLRVAAPDGKPADLRALADTTGRRIAHAYEVVPVGCQYRITTVAGWTR